MITYGLTHLNRLSDPASPWYGADDEDGEHQLDLRTYSPRSHHCHSYDAGV